MEYSSMEYNWVNIGKRIADLRKSKKDESGKGWSQERLIEELAKEGISISRNTLSGIENGKSMTNDFDAILKLCKIFHCELGFLLCEYDDCKTRDDQFIHDSIGLSQESIDTIRSWNKFPQNLLNFQTYLDNFIQNSHFQKILENISEYMLVAKVLGKVETDGFRYIRNCERNMFSMINETSKNGHVDISGDLLAYIIMKGDLTPDKIAYSLIEESKNELHTLFKEISSEAK